MSIPSQVRKQSEAVQQLYKELNVDPESQPTPKKVAGAPDGAGDPVQDNAAADANGQAPTPATTERNVAGNQDEETFESKYRTLQGKYNAEVPRLSATNRDLVSRVEQLEGLIATMSTNTAPANKSVAEAMKLITEADIEEYGDSIDVMRKAAREENSALHETIRSLEATVREMQSSVLPRVDRLSYQQAQSSEQSFWGNLNGMAPDWQSINSDPDFQSWLLEVDPMTGTTRQTHLEDAQRSLDAHRVASFFAAWPGRSSNNAPQTGRTPASELERQVAPGRGRTSPTPSGSEAKTYTPVDIKKFFDDVRTGKFKGREQERDRLERDIFAAQREGRIVNA